MIILGTVTRRIERKTFDERKADCCLLCFIFEIYVILFKTVQIQALTKEVVYLRINVSKKKGEEIGTWHLTTM